MSSKFNLSKTLLFLINLIICKINCLPENYYISKDYGNNLEKNLDSNSVSLSDSTDLANFRKELGENILKYINQSADPCNDFHQYACGNWKQYHEIPIHEESYDFIVILKEKIINLLHDIFANETYTIEKESNNEEDKTTNQIRMLFNTCNDTITINERKSEPLLNFFKTLGGFPLLDKNWSVENFSLEETLSDLSLLNMNSIFHFNIYEDLEESNRRVIYIFNPELGLKNPTDYLDSDNELHLDAYRNFIQEILTILNDDEKEIDKLAEEIIKFETHLADASLSGAFVDFYIVQNIRNLTENFPKFNWKFYFDRSFEENFNNDTKIVFFTGPNLDVIYDLLINTDKRLLANYLNWIVLQQMVPYLDDRFQIPFAKLTKTLTGSNSASQARGIKCTIITNEKLGFAVSAIYVKKYFNENSKDEITRITEEMKNTFRENLLLFDWLDDETRHLAEQKLNKTILELAYPDFILNKTALNNYYNDLDLQSGKYFENILNIRKFQMNKIIQNFKQNIANIWPVSPTQVNAFFENAKNRIIWPASFLQSPIYHKDFPKALNYGAFGTFFGHELTHGFDSTGRSFDQDGKIKDWWTNSSIEYFTEKEQCFIDQYEKFSIYNKTIDGDLSKSENIADNGGLQLAFKTYQKWLNSTADEEKKMETLPGLEFLSHEQLFFLGLAQSWCDNIRQEAIEMKIESDEHPPWIFRIIGSLQNSHEFSKSYNCPENSYMNPTKKCKLW